MFTKNRLLTFIACAPAALVALGCSGTESEGDTASTGSEALSAPTCAPSLANGAVPRFDRALLDTIATTEGTRGRGEDGYNVTFAYHYFTSCAHHPNLDICAGICSTAAGRYQFLNTTWAGLGLPTFHPDNQDRGAMKLVARRGASVPSTRAMTATEFVNVMDRISKEWASLPPGRYGQPTYTMSRARATYCSFAGCDGTAGGGGAAAGCHSDTLNKEVANNACVQSKSDSKWYQCDAGHWVDRFTDPTACSSVHPL